jgi:aspartyl-tRNA(Asn)/glutamyl-tRNA(Gln) amidotransferase subunit B
MAVSDWSVVIGLEVHAEMLTATKMFSNCPVVDSVTAEPNTAVDPLSLGMPGTLPVINMQAMEYGMMVGLALNCEIPPFNQFARKNYFYPDLPKGYQISQYDHPLAIKGYVDIELEDGSSKRIIIRRAHMEEDTGKLTHAGLSSLVDYNRAGVPLLEIVSEPDIRSSYEAEAYSRKLRTILQFLGVNHGDMSKGVLRFEANVSVMHKNDTEFRQRTEIKNLNSIRSMVRAIDVEVQRQIKLWENGKVAKLSNPQHSVGMKRQVKSSFNVIKNALMNTVTSLNLICQLWKSAVNGLSKSAPNCPNCRTLRSSVL